MEKGCVSTLAIGRNEMTTRLLARLAVPLILALAFTGSVFAGGWATITLKDFPEYTLAGTPLNLTFTIRQHGHTPLSGLHPALRATTTGGLNAKSEAHPGKDPGEYTATITLPQPGEWTIDIASGFNDSALKLPALKVIAAGTAGPAPFAANTRGLRLFASKGCVGCHRHLEVNPERATDPKFDLTGRRFPQEYLTKFLADPSIKTPDMPNLGLKSDEIEALTAFINKLVTKTARQGGVQ
jgi:mono/diheme cytochrome c family protein